MDIVDALALARERHRSIIYHHNGNTKVVVELDHDGKVSSVIVNGNHGRTLDTLYAYGVSLHTSWSLTMPCR